MKADSANPMLRSMMQRYLVDNEIAPKELTGETAEKALKFANGSVRTANGKPAYDVGDLALVREVLMEQMSSVVEKMGASSEGLRDASSTQSSAAGFGGTPSTGSPAYARFNVEPKGKAAETLSSLTSGDGENPVFERLGNALERWMAAHSGANSDWDLRINFDDLVKNRSFGKGLVELVGNAEPGDLGKAMKALGAKAGPEVGEYFQDRGNPEVYQRTQAPRPKSEPELTALRTALELTVIDVKSLEIPIENVFRSEGGRAAFASYVKDLVGKSDPSDERREQFRDELNAGTPLELKPMRMSRVELGETKAKQAIDAGDLDGFKAVLNGREGLQSLGAMRVVESLLQEGMHPLREQLGKMALETATERGMDATAARLQPLL